MTDNEEPITNKPKNVKIIYKTLDDIKAIASEKLDFTVNIDCPYKLCDFKPAYGLIFSEYINGYDFWGTSDIDIIYGNIRNFITNDVLDDYDVISVRNDYFTGFFALYRNVDYTNNLFKKSKTYRAVFQNKKYLGFDECGLLCDSLMEGASIYNLPAEIESMTHIIKALDAEFLETYVSHDFYRKVLMTYSNFETEENWKALLLWWKFFRSHQILLQKNLDLISTKQKNKIQPHICVIGK